tara:strand:- start:775 stop:1968 length:1194 start_codon:yes stop_codon:yes gene_type:complete
MFNVLWIDDEYEDLIEDYNELAEAYGIKLTGFESYEELKEEMTNKFHNYQAVVLDGVFKIKKSDINPKDDKALLKSIKFLMNEEKKGRRIDIFCLSGNPPFLKNDNQALRMEEIPVFRKNNFKGFDKNYEEKTIWECIEKKCEQKAQNDIREKYKEPLTLFEEEYLGNKHKERVINILKEIDGSNFSEFHDLNSLRKVVEYIIQKLCDKEVLPNDKAFKSKKLNNTKRLFQNTHDHYILKSNTETIFSPLLKFIYCNLVDVIQDGSHEGDEMKLEVDNYVMENKSNNYISKIYVFQLLEFMNGTLRLMKEIENYTEVNFFKTKNIYNQEVVVTLETPKNGNPGVLLSNEYGLSTKYKDLKAGDMIKITEFTEGEDWLKSYGCKYFITKYDKVKNTDF